MDTYGCEFIDDGVYGTYEPKRKEPWRRYPDAFELPIPYVAKKLADQGHIRLIVVKDREQVSLLCSDIAAHGLDEPVTLTYDIYGKVSLTDGHHRLLAMQALTNGVGLIPCRMVRTTSALRGPGSALLTDVPMLLSLLAKNFP